MDAPIPGEWSHTPEPYTSHPEPRFSFYLVFDKDCVTVLMFDVQAGSFSLPFPLQEATTERSILFWTANRLMDEVCFMCMASTASMSIQCLSSTVTMHFLPWMDVHRSLSVWLHKSDAPDVSLFRMYIPYYDDFHYYESMLNDKRVTTCHTLPAKGT
jgi:hypothetical protein